MKTLIRRAVVLLFVMVTGMLSFSFAAVQAEEPEDIQMAEGDDTQLEEEKKDLPAPGTVFTTKGGLFGYNRLTEKEIRMGDITYKFTITKSGEDGEGEVELTGSSWKLKKGYKKVWIHYNEDTATDASGEEYRITSIGKRAFVKADIVCIDSKYIERIGGEAFTGCDVVSIGGGDEWKRVKGSSKMERTQKHVKKLKKIGGKAFTGVKGRVDIYATEIGEIGAKAFSGFKDDVYIKATEIGRISSNAFSGVKGGVDIHATKIDEIGPKAFSGVKEQVDIEATEIGKIGSNAFSGVRGDNGVRFRVGKIGEVGSGVFANVKWVNLYEGGIDRRLFRGCNKTLQLDFGQQKELDAQTMSGVENVREVNVTGDKITKISANAFKNFKKVKRIYIQCPNVTRIEDRAFAGCKKVKEIVLAEKINNYDGWKNLTAIGSQIVSGCKELKSIELGINKKLRSIKKDAFKGANAGFGVYVHGRKSWAFRLKGKGATVFWVSNMPFRIGFVNSLRNGGGKFSYKKI